MEDFLANAAKSEYYFSAGNMPHKFALGTCNFHRAHRTRGNFPWQNLIPCGNHEGKGGYFIF